MAVEVAAALASRDLACCTVTIKVRYGDFTTITRSRTLPAPLRDGRGIADCALELVLRTEALSRPVRLLGVTASNLVHGQAAQLHLFG
jgi:DNA polymerase-4